MYCGKCCKRNSGREICCIHCGHQLCSDPGPDAGARHKVSETEIIERPIIETKPEPKSIFEPKPKPEKRKTTTTYEIKRQYIHYPINTIRKIVKREPVELGPKDYAMLGIPIVLVVIQLALLSTLGPAVLRRMNLDSAAYKLMNMDQAFFKQEELEKQIVGLWAFDPENSPDFEMIEGGFTKSQIMFTEDKMLKIILIDENGNEANNGLLEGPYTIHNKVLTAQLVSPNDTFESRKVSCVIEMTTDKLMITWVSGFDFESERDNIEMTYQRIDADKSLFSKRESSPSENSSEGTL